MNLPARWIVAALLAGVLAWPDGAARAQSSSEFAPLPESPRKEKQIKPVQPAPAPVAAAPAPSPAETPAVAAPSSPIAPQPSVASAPAAPAANPAPPASASLAPSSDTPANTPAPAGKSFEKAKETKEAKEKKKAPEKTAKKEPEEKPEPKPEKVDLKFASKLPPDDKGPRAIEFISKCLDNYDRCIAYVTEQAAKIPASDVCLQEANDQTEVTEKVRKYITLRPAIHDQAANRMVTEALYVIYPCRRAGPEKTAKGAKVAQ